MAFTINNTNLRLLNVYPETIADGDGIRYSIYLAGCTHACLKCHNPESWSPTAGTLLTDDVLAAIIQEINANKLLDGITLSGGDPFFNPLGLRTLLHILKQETNLNIWCYTGYTYEQLLDDDARRSSLKDIDVLVDGRFEISQFDPRLLFRGSHNQRIIYLKKDSYAIDYICEDTL